MPLDPLSTGLAIASLIVAIATLLVGTVISVVLYALGRRLDFRSKMRRWDDLHTTVNSLFIERRDELHDVILMNAKRYEKDYDGGNNANRHGYIMSKGELLGPRHNGVELICDTVATWTNSNGRRTLRRPRPWAKNRTRAENVYEVGFVPFEYIDHINLHGDEYRAEVIFYVKHNGPGKSPYRSFTYVEGRGKHIGPSGRLYFDPVHELGEWRPNRLTAWLRFQRTRVIHRRMDRASRKHMKDLGPPAR